MFQAIQTADLEWKCIDGIEIPFAKQFGDIYFSKDNGLLETRHVFLNGNDLPARLAQLNEFGYFHVGETGFGSGLNILALWQLWQNVRPNNQSRLHVTTVEKFPLSRADLIRALRVWPELKSLSEQLIEQYPLPISGCHRLNFPNERFSIDLWLGDAHDVFPMVAQTSAIDAWFLDGFAPSCNPDMWEEHVLKNIVRLSKIGTTFSSFSVAGILKRGLKAQGISISRPRGFLHKKEMLKGVWQTPKEGLISDLNTPNIEDDLSKVSFSTHTKKSQRHIAIIGAGIAGLSCAYAFAQRGHSVLIYDQFEPLSGASGNPLALLNPKLCPIEQSAEHLMTLSWQHALNHYAKFKAYRPIAVNQLALKNSDDLLALAGQYPEGLLKAQTNVVTDNDSNKLHSPLPSLQLTAAGAVSPHQLRDEISSHPNIKFVQAKVGSVSKLDNNQLELSIDNLHPNKDMLNTFDHVIVCCARDSKNFFTDFPVLKPIRGQVSWLNNAEHALSDDQAYSYGGYCMQLDAEHLILGASFYPNREDAEVLLEDHQHNRQLIEDVFPDYAKQLAPIEEWQGRASVRAQSLDYFPLLGKMQDDTEIYTFSGLGSKGFLFAPLCSEILVAEILNEASPVPTALMQKLNVKRFAKKVKAKKPYYQKIIF